MVMPQEFRFNAGRLALDLAATVRRRASTRNDVLARPGAPARWLNAAGLVDAVPALTPDQESALRDLREAIWAAAAAAAAGTAMPAAAVARLNAVAAHPLATPRLDPATATVRFVADDPLRTALATVARDAIDLLGGPLRSHIKACAQADCRMLFLDSSRSGRRRWCSMDRCGSRAKGETFRHRHQESRHEPCPD